MNTKKLLSAVSGLLVLVMLAGCGEVKRSQEAAFSMLAAFKAADFETAKTYLDDPKYVAALEYDDNVMSKPLLKTALSTVEYEVLSVKKTKTGAIAKVKITNYDGKVLAENIYIKYSMALIENEKLPASEKKPLSDFLKESIQKIIPAEYAKENLPKVTNEIEVNFVKKNGKMLAQFTQDTADALTGGMVKALNAARDIK